MTGKTDDQPHYEVGYAKPPAHSKFAKGVSGNPAGRPKGSLNLKTLHQRVYGREVEVTIDGQKITVSRLEAGMLVECEFMMKGDPRAREAAFKRQETYDAQDDSGNEDHGDLTDDDRQILERWRDRRPRKH